MGGGSPTCLLSKPLASVLTYVLGCAREDQILSGGLGWRGGWSPPPHQIPPVDLHLSHHPPGNHISGWIHKMLVEYLQRGVYLLPVGCREGGAMLWMGTPRPPTSLQGDHQKGMVSLSARVSLSIPVLPTHSWPKRCFKAVAVATVSIATPEETHLQLVQDGAQMQRLLLLWSSGPMVGLGPEDSDSCPNFRPSY